jgi:transposase
VEGEAPAGVDSAELRLVPGITLERLEDEPMEAVVHDEPRSGRPRKLTSDQWDKLNQMLENSPNEVGIEAPHWTPRIVQHLIEEKFDTEYTKRHVQDLLHEAGYTWKTARPEYAKGDERAREAFKEGVKKTDSPE